MRRFENPMLGAGARGERERWSRALAVRWRLVCNHPIDLVHCAPPTRHSGGHDEPMLHAGNETELEENMVIAIEPILKDSAGRRYTVEDTYLVTAAGPQLLTTATDTQTMHRIW